MDFERSHKKKGEKGGGRGVLAQQEVDIKHHGYPALGPAFQMLDSSWKGMERGPNDSFFVARVQLLCFLQSRPHS